VHRSGIPLLFLFLAAGRAGVGALRKLQKKAAYSPKTFISKPYVERFLDL
jgi:hypothetical protein